MKNLYFITRFWGEKNSGGILLRKENVKYLQQAGFNTFIITTNAKNEDNIFSYPFDFQNKLPHILVKLGLSEDYLNSWANIAYNDLKNKVGQDDYVYATTGGELSTLKLGYLLKKTKGLKFIIHFHDPILYLKYQGLQFIHNTGFYYFREKALRKYLQAADLIITTSKTFYTTLIEEFNVDNNKIINNYFGYINKLELKQGFDISKIKIVYGGVFDRLQKPEILAKLLEKQNNCIINYVGEYKNYIPLQKYLDKQNINFYDNMPYNDYVNFATSNCNVGFVPLVEDYLKFCVPSKIYELINMGIPILGLLPDGDAMDIINKNGYGKAFKHNELDKFKNFVDELVEKPEELLKFRENILKDRDNWFIGNKFRDVITRISNL